MELRNSETPDIQVDFDIHSPHNVEGLHDVYRRLRTECPVAHTSNYGGHWIATRYDDINEIMRDPHTFSNQSVNIPDTIGQDGPLIPLEVDQPEHTLYRGLLNPLFNPRRMRELEPRIREIVTKLIDEMLQERQVDFVEAFAKRLPTRVFLALMGWNIDDAPLFNQWADSIVMGKPGASEEESTEFRLAAAKEVYAYFAKMMDIRDAAEVPADDITQILLNSRVDGRDLSQVEVLNMLFLMLIAGLHTVQSALAHTALFMAENPEIRQELVDDLSIVPTAVEEMLRWEPGTCPARLLKADTVVGGVQMRAGDKVLIPVESANHDETAFKDADTVDLRRNPNPHLAFGAGIHRCVGSHLARMELRVAFEELHARMPHYRLDPEHPPTRHLSQVKGLHSLHIIVGESL